MNSLFGFCALTYAVTWACWMAASAVPFGSTVAWMHGPLILLGVFAPSLVAISLTARADGRVGLTALLRRLFQWRVPARWYLFAVGYMAAIKLTVALVHRIATGAWPHFGQDAWYTMVAATVMSTVVGGQAGEEIGWRGYALPRLESRVGLAYGSVILGVLWASWHLPLVFMALGADTVG